MLALKSWLPDVDKLKFGCDSLNADAQASKRSRLANEDVVQLIVVMLHPFALYG